MSPNTTPNAPRQSASFARKLGCELVRSTHGDEWQLSAIVSTLPKPFRAS